MKHDYELWQDGVMVASTDGPGAKAEIFHCATQYMKDGPIEIRCNYEKFQNETKEWTKLLSAMRGWRLS